MLEWLEILVTNNKILGAYPKSWAVDACLGPSQRVACLGVASSPRLAG